MSTSKYRLQDPVSFRPSQFTPLVHLRPAEGAERLERVAIEHGRSGGSFDEAWLQRLIYEHPELLPVGEISPSHGPLIPACLELGTHYVDLGGEWPVFSQLLLHDEEAKQAGVQFGGAQV